MTWTLTTPPSVASTGTTASAPCGIGAPVMIRIVCPGASDSAWVLPAAMSLTTGRTTGCSGVAVATSAAWTAYPSIAELVKPGSEPRAVTSSARTAPWASRTPCSKGRMTVTVPRMRLRCCSTVITVTTLRGSAAVRREPVEHRTGVLAQLRRVWPQPHDGLEVVEPVAGVVAAAAEDDAVHAGTGRVRPGEGLEGVGQLDLVAPSRWGVLEHVEDRVVEDVAADDGEVARRIGGVRLLDEARHPHHVAVPVRDCRAAVEVDRLRGHLHERDDAAAVLVAGGEHLLEQVVPRVDEVVAEQHGERVVPHVLLGHVHRVPQAARLAL